MPASWAVPPQTACGASLRQVSDGTTRYRRSIVNVNAAKVSAMSIVASAPLRLSENALRVLERRYLRKDSTGKSIESPDQMFRRVARVIAAVELTYDPRADVRALEEEFYAAMGSLYFLPNSPTLMNAGRELGQLSGCFVIPIDDSIESIFEAIKNAALVQKSGGGTGFSFSRIRPKNDLVRSTKGIASGPVSFLHAFNSATEAVKQGGTRRGANIGVLRVDHSDIVDFIRCKEDNSQVTNFNISVALTDTFMDAMRQDADWILINPHTSERTTTVPARELFDLMVDMAWKNGEPGIIFIDRINRDNPTPHLGGIESTNPCGEQPLLPYESCNLGSINLSLMVRDGAIDWDRLKATVSLACRFLDNVIDANRYPLPQIEERTKRTRKIGLGVMGFADMLIELGIPYDSEEGAKTGGEVMEFIQEIATAASQRLAAERGDFPAFKGSVYDRSGTGGMRNAARTTIAPTGTISMIADCSSGIEPLFSLAYVKKVMDGERLLYVNRHFERVARARGFYSREVMDRIAEAGSIRSFPEIPKDVRRLFATALDISPEWHVRMQAVFQHHTDNAVSKTINFPHSATKEDVRRAFELAYELGCKGLTVYRDGSREQQVINIGTKDVKGAKGEAAEETSVGGPRKPRARPEVTSGTTEKIGTGCGNLYVTVNADEHGPFEVFASLGKSGGCEASQTEAISRLVSLALRSGIGAEAIIKQIRGIRCPRPYWRNGHAILSCPDAISRALTRYEAERGRAVNVPPEPARQYARCAKCGGVLEYVEGCEICRGCGYSRCE
jgi:ribonucleoside-diphosphate reductase alpha chain